MVKVGTAVTHGIETSDDASDARAGDIVDGDATFLYHLQHPYLSGALGPASTQGKTYFRSVGGLCFSGGKGHEGCECQHHGGYYCLQITLNFHRRAILGAKLLFFPQFFVVGIAKKSKEKLFFLRITRIS